MDINLNLEFKQIIKNIDLNNKPNLFLHVCCGPCSTSVLERIKDYFNIFIIFYNPNIDTKYEFDKRFLNFEKLLNLSNFKFNILYHDYNHSEFLSAILGLENEPEGGDRCKKCFELRLKYSKIIALNYINKHNLNKCINYLCTTLSLSPHKNANLIYNIGCSICDESNLLYLPSDFKKEDGYLNSILLSKKFGLYRQKYCGCEFSKNE